MASYQPLCFNAYRIRTEKLTHTGTHPCVRYPMWTVFCSRVVKKNTFFKLLPFALKILFGADFVSVFPLNNLLQFATDNDMD